MDSTERNKTTKDNEKPNVFVRITNWRLQWLVWKGYKNALSEEDLLITPAADSSRELGKKLQKNWSAEVEAAQRTRKKPSLVKAIVRTYIWQYCLLGILLFTDRVVFRLGTCFLTGALLEFFVEGADVHHTEALICGGLLTVVLLCRITLTNTYIRAAAKFGGRVRAACSLLLYNKALQRRGGPGQPDRLLGLLTGNAGVLEASLPGLHWLWLLHVQSATGAAFLYYVLDLPGIYGLVATYLIFVPMHLLVWRTLLPLRKCISGYTSTRVRLMSEVVTGMTAIKVNTWERVFAEAVAAARRSEMSKIALETIIGGVTICCSIMADRLSVFLTLLFQTLVGEKLIASKIFTVVQFYSDFRLSINVCFPGAVSALSECKVSIEKMQEFLLEEDEVDTGASEDKVRSCLPEGTVELRDASFHWPADNTDVLRGISVLLPPGTLCAVVGPVASGKTSLLLALLGELRVSGGSTEVSGTTSYAPQEPWVFSSSVRQNVLLGESMDSGRYNQVLAACALLGDLQRLPAGDATCVGERGARLSGGQRARLGLARAVYRDADVYLLDDPLSAVDAHVASHVFQECIVKLLAGKTRLLVTHQLNLLPLCDYVIIMNQGHIEIQGTFKEIQEKSETLRNIISLTLSTRQILEEADNDEADGQAFVSENSHLANDASSCETKDSTLWSILVAYLRAGFSTAGLLGLVGLLLISQATTSGAFYWIGIWSDVESNEPSTGRSRWLLLGVHAGLVMACVLLLTLRVVALGTLTLHATRSLHDATTSALLAAGLPFYQRCSAGALIAYCSEDVSTVDRVVPLTLILYIQLLMNIASNCIVPIIVDYETALPIVVGLLLLCYIFKVYSTAMRSARALENIRRTRLYAHVSDSVNGLVCIRALGKTDKILEEFCVHQDDYTSSKEIAFEIASEGNLWVERAVALFILLAVITIIMAGESVGVTAGLVGVAVTQLLTLCHVVSRLLEESTKLQRQLSSVQRALNFARVPPEANVSTSEKYMHKDWLLNGSIEFKAVSLKYEKGPIALKDISLKIQDGEKVAVVGRTGAGKSTLVGALLRLTPAGEGAVLLGGVDVSTVPLATLRHAVALIPQQPTLFSGTLRYNLDPAGEHDDAAIWQALQNVELNELVAATGLESPVGAGGGGWSAGQKQLVCLARAALRNPRVLIMDEATANIDYQTDFIIQRTLRKLFSRCTVIFIAHRIHTIMDCDRVLVMDSGKIAQFGHPYTLLKETDGTLYKLVMEAGADVFENFIEKAKQAYERLAASYDKKESEAYSVD